MARVRDNWCRLVNAAVQRELRPGLHEHTSGLAALVRPSLGRTTNIDALLQAADEIQDQDSNVAQILCEQAYSMAQNLDPNCKGIGELQFRTGLASVIKRNLAKKGGSQIDRSNDIERIWEFYQQYKQKHRVEDF